MSIFNEILQDVLKIGNSSSKNINDSLKDAIQCINKFEEEFINERAQGTTQKDESAMTNLQSVHDDDDEPNKLTSAEGVSTESTDCNGSKKRSKNEVEERQKCNASISAQANIAKKENVNQTQKLRRYGSFEKPGKARQKEDDRENAEPVQESSRSLRASSCRSSKQTEEEQPLEARPKGARPKKVTESATNENEKDNTVAVENGTAPPAHKRRHKRTRRRQKAAQQKEEKQDNELERQETAKQVKEPEKQKNKKGKQVVPILISAIKKKVSIKENTTFDQTGVINEMDQTMELSYGVYNHEPVTTKAVRQMNKTAVIEKCNQTVVLDKQSVMNEAVVIEKSPQEPNMSEDNSFLTHDSDTIEHIPPHKPPVTQPPFNNIIKKVQQFEEMATGVTRTKTRAIAKKKKQKLARKVAETEERRKAEELARQRKLAEEQKRAGDRKKQLLENKTHMREFKEKQKMKNKLDGDKIHMPFKIPTTPKRAAKPPLEPVYMADGFQNLSSDEEAEPVEHTPPAWSVSEARDKQLYIQSYLDSSVVDKLFGERKHTPDLREIFPNIERNRLKRTSSVVWTIPPLCRERTVLTD